MTSTQEDADRLIKAMTKIVDETFLSLMNTEFVDGVSQAEKEHICRELMKAISAGKIKNIKFSI